MYIENEGQPESMTSTDKDVNEATAALKGMLGIGGGGAAPATPKESGKKSKKGKGKQSNNSTPKRTTKNSDNNNTHNQNPKSTGKGKKKDNTQGQPRKENFAWSAFQASPDASALPLPAFISSASSLRATNDLATKLDPDKLSTLLSGAGQPTDMPPPIEMLNAPRAEDLEAQQIAAAEKAAEPVVETVKKAEPEKPVSASGINLAAIAASPPSRSRPAPPNPPPASSLTPATPFSSPAAQYGSPSPYRGQQQQQSPFLPPSPGYVTIQVQVPPILGPDRRMVVASPAGYPVQIMVPQGVPPGMVIPVHVPTGPMMPPQSPYGGGGYHPHPQQQQHMHYQQQQQQFRQLQYHQQQQQQHPPPQAAVSQQQQQPTKK
jgi:hypothetical protein